MYDPTDESGTARLDVQVGLCYLVFWCKLFELLSEVVIALCRAPEFQVDMCHQRSGRYAPAPV